MSVGRGNNKSDPPNRGKASERAKVGWNRVTAGRLNTPGSSPVSPVIRKAAQSRART